VGYAAYESVIYPDSTPPLTPEDALAGSIKYLRTKARPSPAFGVNNIVINEFGIPENNAYYAAALKPGIRALQALLKEPTLPWINLWQLYGNDPNVDASGNWIWFPPYPHNARADAVLGLWIREPSGELGPLCQHE